MREESSPNTPHPHPSSEKESQALYGPPNPQTAIHLLRAWRQGNEEEQSETLAYLKQALDTDRLSNRKIFSS